MLIAWRYSVTEQNKNERGDGLDLVERVAVMNFGGPGRVYSFGLKVELRGRDSLPPGHFRALRVELDGNGIRFHGCLSAWDTNGKFYHGAISEVGPARSSLMPMPDLTTAETVILSVGDHSRTFANDRSLVDVTGD